MAKRTRNIKKPEYGKRIIKSRYPKLYPSLYCLSENKYICFSVKCLKPYIKTVHVDGKHPKRVLNYKKRIDPNHFNHVFCTWTHDSYKIDLKNYKSGDIVKCPVCNGPVDFRAFPSNSLPKFVDNEKN